MCACDSKITMWTQQKYKDSLSSECKSRLHINQPTENKLQLNKDVREFVRIIRYGRVARAVYQNILQNESFVDWTRV